MGRETKFLLAVLGVLGGAFVGVLSMKLLVPRPPTGAGPDVDPQEQVAAGHDIVEPPTLEPRTGRSAFTATRDPFLARASFADPVDMADATETAEPASAAEPAPPDPGAAIGGAGLASSASGPIVGAHVTVPGDTWWSIAERAYGDGRLYRAMYAWNRRLDPRVSTAPGTRLEIPPLSKLTAAWPRLVPRE